MVERVLADDEKSCMLLVMRTLSIVPLNFKVCVHCVIAEDRWLNCYSPCHGQRHFHGNCWCSTRLSDRFLERFGRLSR